MKNRRSMVGSGTAQIVSLPFAILFIMLVGCTVVWADNLPPGEEPWLAEPVTGPQTSIRLKSPVTWGQWQRVTRSG